MCLPCLEVVAPRHRDWRLVSSIVHTTSFFRIKSNVTYGTLPPCILQLLDTLLDDMEDLLYWKHE